MMKYLCIDMIIFAKGCMVKNVQSVLFLNIGIQNYWRSIKLGECFMPRNHILLYSFGLNGSQINRYAMIFKYGSTDSRHS